MKGVVLHHETCEESQEFIHIIVLSHNPDPGSSTCAYVSFFRNSMHQRTVHCNWPTSDFFRFVKTFNEFPMGRTEGGFYSIELELEEMTWRLDELSGLYELTFRDRDYSFSIKARREQINKFGQELEKEMREANIDTDTDIALEVQKEDEHNLLRYDDLLKILNRDGGISFEYKDTLYEISIDHYGKWHVYPLQDRRNTQLFDTYQEALEQAMIKGEVLHDILAKIIQGER